MKQANSKYFIETVDIKNKNKINKPPKFFPSYGSDENVFVNNGHNEKFEGSNSKTKNNLKTVHGQKDNNTGNSIEKPLPDLKIRVDRVSIQKVKNDINVKNKNIQITIDDPIVSTKVIKNTKYRVNNKHKELKKKYCK